LHSVDYDDVVANLLNKKKENAACKMQK